MCRHKDVYMYWSNRNQVMMCELTCENEIIQCLEVHGYTPQKKKTFHSNLLFELVERVLKHAIWC